MKKGILFLILFSYYVIGQAQSSFNLCNLTSSTSVITGTLYDSGGPAGSYMNGEFCQFLISPGCNATISLSFSQFNTESCCDFLSVYNGSNTASPLIGTYAGSSLPPTLVANSGHMFLNWSTDGSIVGSGFIATWTAVVSGTIAPVANFSISNVNPPLNSPIQFTDLTTNMPNQWFWQFGDFTTSNSQNPTKSYTTPGLKTVTLTATNCNTTSIVTKTLMVQSAPSISVSPTVLTASAACGGSVVVPLTISNNGSGQLNVSINGVGSSQVKVLAITNYVDMVQEYPMTLNAISSYFTNYTVTQHALTNVASFQSALTGMNVLLIPEQETYVWGFMQTYSTTILNFVNAGGTAILCGSGYANQINDIGLFSCSNIWNYSGNISIVDTNDVIMTTLPMGAISSPNATWYSLFTNPGNIDYVKMGVNNVVTKRIIGLGRAIYIGFDYFNYTPNSARIIANAVKSSLSLPSWLSSTVNTASVSPSNSIAVSYTFNASNLAAGNYTASLVINTNDPSSPVVNVPVSFTVSGVPSLSLSANCINFGSVMQFTNKVDSVTIYNTGCAPLTVSSMSTSTSVFSYTPNISYTIAPWSSKVVKVKFSPVTAGLFLDTLYVTNNAGNIKICLSGNATTAPSISVSPSSLSSSVTCGGTQTVNLTVYNNGGPNLTFTVNGSSSPNSTVNVLAITNYVDMAFSGEYNNTIAAINSYFSNFNVTQHSLSNVSALQSALVGKHVLLIPEQESYVNGFMQTYSTTIVNFVNNGGTAILCGTGNAAQVNDIGLFSCSSSNWNPTSIAVVDTNDAIMKTLPMGNIFAPNATMYNTFTNPGISDYVKFGTFSVVSKRLIGSGRAIYLGFDYFNLDNNSSKMIANSVKSSVSSVNWLSASPLTATVVPSASTIVTFTFNANNLVSGNYTTNVLINSNDPIVPTVTVPVSFTVSGAPSLSLSANCINFGSVMQFTNKVDSVTIYNTGCAPLTVSSMSTSTSVFSYTPNISYTIAPWSSKVVKVKFSPVTAGLFLDTLYVTNNAGNIKICLSGNATTAPSISVSPSNMSVFLPACNGTQTFNLMVYNTGGPNLTFTVNGSSSPNSTVNVLAITNYVDMAFSGEYNNTIAAINSYFSNFNVTQHSLSNVSAFQSALVGKHVLLIPEQESYVNGFMQTYSTTIVNFVSNGGTAILCGTGNAAQVNDIGLFSCSSSNWNPTSIAVVDTNDAIMKTLPMGNIFAPNATMYNTFTNPGISDYVKSGTFSVVSKRLIGSGRAIYLGFDYYNLDNNSSKMIANSVKSSLSSVSWLSSGPSSATVTPSSSTAVTFTFNSGNLTAGTYTYNVIINSNDPITPNYTVPVTMVVGNNPCANFSFTNPNNCSGIVSFTQNVINTVTSYSWNFGNNTSSTLANPVVTYTAPGTYSVTLTACNGTLCSSITKTLNISNVGGPISAVCSPTNIYYSTNYGILNVSLNTINNVSGYTSPEGGYKDFSCTNQTSLTIGSNYLLSITTNNFYNENVSVYIDFDNNGSFTPAELVLQTVNQLTTHTLNFTPPPTAVLNTPLRMRVIDDASGYNILNACNNTYYGQTEDYAVTIKPNNVPPAANFTETINACQGTVVFTDMSTNNPTSWMWNFGNSAVSTLQNPVYTYTVPGTYTVTLVATNAFGSSFYSKVITVNPLAFTIGYSTPAIINQPVTFTTNLTGAVSYVWDFGDGNLAGTATAFNTYTAAGTYTVKLTIVFGSCVNTMSTTINVGNPTDLLNRTQASDLLIYPNPFKNETSITLFIGDKNSIALELYNSIGQVIETDNLNDLKNGENIIMLRDLKPGVYFLKVSQGNVSKTYKLISVN